MPEHQTELSLELPAQDVEEHRGVFTGDRLFLRKPEVYRAIIELTAQGVGALLTARILSVSPSTVLAVREREQDSGSIEIEKSRIARLARGASRLCVEAIVELLSDPVTRAEISAKDLAIVCGVLVDKAELLSGSPTVRIATSDSSVDDVIDYVTRLRGQDAGQRGAGTLAGATAQVRAIEAPGASLARPGAVTEAVIVECAAAERQEGPK